MEIHKETYASQILKLVALSCEISHLAVKILCNDTLGSCKSTLWRMRQKVPHTICGEKTTESIALISRGGKGKGIRLTKSAIPLLKQIDPELFTIYMQRSHQHRGKVNAKHSRRLQALSEIVAVMKRADVELLPNKKVQLSKTYRGIAEKVVKPSFYISTELKNHDTLREMSYSRFAGLFITPQKPYVVYSTGKGVFEWRKSAEERIQVAVERIVRSHFIFDRSDSIFMTDAMMVFGEGIRPAISMLATPATEWEALHGCFWDVHYVPKNRDGIMMICLMASPNYSAKAIKIIGSKSEELVFLDGNLTKLRRFRRACESAPTKSFVIYGAKWQLMIAAHYLQGLQNIQFYEVDMEKLLEAMENQ